MDKSLLITLEYPPQKGGVASYLANLYTRLPSDKIIVAAPKNKKAEDYDGRVGHKIIRWQMLSYFIWPRWLPLYFKVKGLVKKERVKMIHLSHVLPIGYIAYRLKKKMGLRYIVFCHGLDILRAQEKPRKKKWLLKILGEANGIIANSEFTRGLIRNIGVPDDKILVVYPCPAVPKAKETIETYTTIAKYGLANKRIILTVARLVPRKGIDKVIEVMPRLYEKFKNIMYVVVGDGPDLDRLGKLAADKNLQNVVRFVGEVPGEELPKFYAIADIFAMPARQIGSDVEGFGIVYLEANLYGLPVVAGRSGGVPEAVLDRQTGLLVNPEDSNDIYSAIHDLLASPVWANELGENGRIRAENEFQWRKEAKKLRLFLSGHTYG